MQESESKPRTFQDLRARRGKYYFWYLVKLETGEVLTYTMAREEDLQPNIDNPGEGNQWMHVEDWEYRWGNKI